MSAGSDGSIVIDTELDTEGFEKGSDKLAKAIAGMENAFDNLGDNMMDSFNKVVPLLQSIAGSAAQISAALTGTVTQTEAATGKVVESEQRVKQSAEEAAAAVNEQGEAASTFNSSVNNTQGSISALEREVKSLSSGLQAVSNSAEMGFANGKAVLAFDAKLQELEQRLATTREHLAAFGETQIPTEEYTQLTQQVEKAEQALFKLQDRRDAMETLGVDTESTQWKRLTIQIDDAKAKLAWYKRERDSLEENGTAFISGAETSEYAKMESALNDAGEVLNRNKSLIDQEAIAQARLNVLTAQEAVAAATTTREREAAVERLRVAQKGLNDLADSMSNKAGRTEPPKESISGWQRFSAAIKSAAAAALHLTGNLAKAGFGAIKNGISGLVNKLKDFVKQSKKSRSATETLTRSLTSLKRMLITRIKRMFISAIFNEAKEGLQELAKFSDAFNQAMSNIKNSTKGLSANIAVSMGGLITAVEPVLTQIINMVSRLITYINALFSMLRGKSTMTVAKKQTDSYADSLSDAAGAAKKLKREAYGFDELNRQSGDGDSGGGAADLFEKVPIDSILPDNLKDLFQKIKDVIAAGDWYEVGRLIATGLNSVIQTVDDWITNTFRPAGVRWAKNIAEVLNGLTDGLNWNLIGKTISDGLNAIAGIYNTFMDTYNFENLGTSLGDALNGLVDGIEWANIGKAFAQKWQALVELIHGFVHETKWEDLGTGIGTAVQSWFDAIEWAKMADALATGLNGIFASIQSTIDAINWDEVSTKLSEAITTFITNVDWAKNAATLSDLVVHLLQTFNDTVTQEDWEEFGRSIGEALDAIEWWKIIKGVGKAIWNAFSGVISGLFDGDTGKVVAGIGGGLLVVKALFSGGKFALTAAVQRWVLTGVSPLESMPVTIKAIGSKIGSAFSGIASAIGKAVPVVGKAALGVFDAVMVAYDAKSLIDAGRTYNDAQLAHNNETETALNDYSQLYQEKGKEVADEWAKMVYEIDTTNMNFDQAQQTISEKIEGYWDGVPQNMWDGFKQGWNSYFGEGGSGLLGLLSDAFTSAIDGIKNLLGIHSPSTVFAEIGGFLIEGLLQGITNAWTAITSFFSTALTNLKNTLSDAWEKIKTAASEKWDEIKTSVSTTAGNIATTVSNKWNDIKTTASNKWDDIKTTVSNKWIGLKDTLKSVDFSSIGSNLVSGLKNGIVNAWSGLKTKVGDLCSGLTSFVKGIFDEHSPSKVWAAIGRFLGLGLGGGLEDSKRSVLNTAANLAKSVTGEMAGAEIPTLQIDMAEDDLVSRLNIISDKLLGIASVFQNIGTFLDGMGDFRIPEIATGAVIPYKTRTDGGYSDSSQDRFNALMDDVVGSTIAGSEATVKVLKDILDAILGIEIGDEVIGRAAMRYSRRQNLITGG